MQALEHVLMLRLAGTQSRRTLEADLLRELAYACDYGTLRALFEKHRVLPLLGHRLAELAPAAVPSDFVEATRASTEWFRRSNMLLETLAHGLIADLEAAGIPTMLLKGPALARSVYGDLGLRPSSDIDLLVAPEHLRPAVSLIRRFGYDAPRDPVQRNGLPQLHFDMRHGNKLPNVEVHWRVHWYERRFSSEMLTNATAGQYGRQPSLPDELATLLLIYARDGFLGLRQAADIAAWWDRYGEHVAAGCLDLITDRHPALAPALVTSARVAAELVDFPAANVLERPAAHRRARLAERLANWRVEGDVDQCAATVVLIDGLLTPKRALWAFLRRAVLLGPDAIAYRLNKLASNAVAGHLMAIEHGAKLLVRWVIALWRSSARRSLSGA